MASHAKFQVVVLLICCGTCFFRLAASQDTDNSFEDQQGTAQYYRPYNNNRRPSYPAVSRPYYNNYRPSPTRNPTTNYNLNSITGSSRPTTASGTCRSTNSYQQYGICWASDSQRLQISPNLTIENLVRFHSMNLYSPFVWNPSYFQEICQQSSRFNGVGIMCVTTDEDDCISNQGTASAVVCVNDNCICVVGEPYETIAHSITPANQPESFQPGYWAGFYQQLQNTLAASGIYWRPP